VIKNRLCTCQDTANVLSAVKRLVILADLFYSLLHRKFTTTNRRKWTLSMPQRTLVNGHQSDACRCKAQGGLESCMVQTVRLTSSKHRPQQATDADTTQCQCRRDMQPCVNCSSVSDVDSTVKNARFGLVYSWRLIRLALHPPFC